VEVARASSDEGVRLEIRARDKSFEPLDNASVKLAVTAIGAQGAKSTNIVPVNVDATAVPGVYEASYIPRQAGAYRVDAIVADVNGAEVGRAEAGWTSDPAAEEFRSLKPNRALLESIAKQTGGEMVALPDVERFVRTLPNRKAPITENASIPLWHTPVMFLFALACFVAEWGVRRWKGLP
jgi:hypothetical protein